MQTREMLGLRKLPFVTDCILWSIDADDLVADMNVTKIFFFCSNTEEQIPQKYEIMGVLRKCKQGIFSPYNWIN